MFDLVQSLGVKEEILDVSIEILPNKGEKCIVFKCTNHTKEGKFVDKMCAPCYETITTGRLGYSDSFLGEIFIFAKELTKR
jgi:hypothetical protein